MQSMRPTRLEVLDTVLGDNVLTLRRRIRNLTRMMAVVKADAYGHGLIETATIALDCGADALAVATADEGLRLRDAQVRAPILVLGGAPKAAIGEGVERHLSLALYDEDALFAMQQAAKARDTVAHAHLKVDTGMNRLGVRGEANLRAMLTLFERCPNVKLEGLFTHFAEAMDPSFTAEQNARFLYALKIVREAGHNPTAHAAASAAMLNDESLWHDMVRPGIAIYGASVRHLCEGLAPAQRLVTEPMCIETVHMGDSIGYGREYIAPREMQVMTLPIGYGDGYPRSLGGKAAVLIRGQRAPIVGRVCMDMIMVDVTDVPGASMGDEVVLMGSQGELRITPDELAAITGTIPYEIMLGFTSRVAVVHI